MIKKFNTSKNNIINVEGAKTPLWCWMWYTWIEGQIEGGGLNFQKALGHIGALNLIPPYIYIYIIYLFIYLFIYV